MESFGLNIIQLVSNGMPVLSLNPLSWIISGFRSFFSILDRMIYFLVTVLYNLIYDLSNLSITGDFSMIYQRIYTLLAIFMLFKVTFSLITYVISPDQFSDKTAGIQNVIRNIIIVFILLITSPWIFEKIYDIQDAILSEDVIPQFILGASGDNSAHSIIISDRCCSGGFNSDGSCTNEEYYKVRPKTPADYISFVAFRPFFQLTETTTDEEIKNIATDYCYGGSNSPITIAQYIGINSINKENKQKDYIIDYSIVLSTVVGVFLALILISFCFDVAIRSFTLLFLQMFSPIPIISLVDPKSAKNGMFSKYCKKLFQTWMGVFIRIGAFSLAIFFIQLITSSGINLVGGAEPRTSKFWIYLFAVIGALMFAKKFPKILEEITGLKLDGSLKLNPLSRIKDEAILGKQVVGGAQAAAALGIGAAGGLAAGAAFKSAALKNAVKNGDIKGGFKAAGGIFAGASSGMLRGGVGGMTGGYKAKGIGGALKAGASSVQKAGQTIEKYDGTKLRNRVGSSTASRLGLKTAAQKMDAEVKVNEELGKMKDAIMSAADVNDKDMEVEERFYNSTTGMWATIRSNGKGTKSLKKQLEDVEKSGANAQTIAAYRNLYEKSQTAYVNSHLKDKESQVGMLATQLKDIYTKNKSLESVASLKDRMDDDEIVKSLGDLKGMFGDTKTSITKLQSGVRKVDGQTWQEAHATDEAVKRSK